MASKTTKVWLVRERGLPSADCDYLIYHKKPTAHYGSFSWGWNRNELFNFCPTEFHRFSTVRLKPGGGPVQITITISEVEK